MVEGALQELTDLGLDVGEAIYALDGLVSLVIGHVLSELATTNDGGTDPESLARVRALLPEEEFPRVRATLGRGPIDRTAEFEFGLHLMIDGIEKLLDSK